MARRVVLLLVVGACGFDGRLGGGGDDTPEPQGPWLDGYAYRKPVTITRTGTTTLDDFPVGMIANDDDLALNARPDGKDIVVTASDGKTVLDAELVRFDETGALELWTRVAALPPGTTTLYLYYGGAIATATPTAVWSARFAGVWHLSDLASGARDSTTHVHHLGAPTGTQEPAFGSGIAGGSRDTDGLDDELRVADPGDGSLDFASESFSYSLWVRYVAATNQYDLPLWKGGTSPPEPGFCVIRGDAEWSAKIHDGSQFMNAMFTVQTTEWAHLVAVVDRTADRFTAFTNGVRSQNPINIGAFGSLASAQRFNVGMSFNGSVDEVRVYRGTLTTEWIATEHANLADPSFVQLGPEQAR